MTEPASIPVDTFKALLRDSIIQFDNEREHPHAKCEMAMRETYHDLLDVVNDIKHTVDKMAGDVQTIKQRQADLDNKLILLQKISAEHAERIKELEKWQSGIDGVIKTLRNRLWAAIWSALCLAMLGAYNFIRENASLTFK